MTPVPDDLGRLLSRIERDVAQHARNQILIDRMKTITWKDRLMLELRTYNWPLIGGLAFCLLFWSVVYARAEGNVQCPDPGQQCKVIYLSPQEEKMLMNQNGVLDTAAQARNLDLGQFVVYFKGRIATAPQGEVKPLPTDKPLDQK